MNESYPQQGVAVNVMEVIEKAERALLAEMDMTPIHLKMYDGKEEIILNRDQCGGFIGIGEKFVFDDFIVLMVDCVAVEFAEMKDVLFISPERCCRLWGLGDRENTSRHEVPTTGEVHEIVRRHIGVDDASAMLKSKLIVIPICTDGHWKLVAIVNFDNGLKWYEQGGCTRKPRIYVIDSMTAVGRNGNRKLLEETCKLMLNAAMEFIDDMDGVMEEMIRKLPMSTVAVPQQTRKGDWSCGYRVVWHCMLLAMCGHDGIDSPTKLAPRLSAAMGKYPFTSFTKLLRERFAVLRAGSRQGMRQFHSVIYGNLTRWEIPNYNNGLTGPSSSPPSFVTVSVPARREDILDFCRQFVSMVRNVSTGSSVEGCARRLCDHVDMEEFCVQIIAGKSPYAAMLLVVNTSWEQEFGKVVRDIG